MSLGQMTPRWLLVVSLIALLGAMLGLAALLIGHL